MSAPRVLLNDGSGRRGQQAFSPAPDVVWRLLGWVGILLAVLGLTDTIAACVPLNFGSPEWEFGTVAAVLDGLPLPTVGLALLLASSLAQGRRLAVRSVAVLLLVMAGVVVFGAALFVTTVPIALKGVSDPVVLVGLKRAIVKGLVEAVCYPIAYISIAIRSWRHSRPRPGEP